MGASEPRSRLAPLKHSDFAHFVAITKTVTESYESEGRTFESFRARHFFPHTCKHAGFTGWGTVFGRLLHTLATHPDHDQASSSYKTRENSRATATQTIYTIGPGSCGEPADSTTGAGADPRCCRLWARLSGNRAEPRSDPGDSASGMERYGDPLSWRLGCAGSVLAHQHDRRRAGCTDMVARAGSRVSRRHVSDRRSWPQRANPIATNIRYRP